MSVLWTILAIAAGQIALALGLIASQHPRSDLRGGGLDFKRISTGGAAPPPPEQSYRARDGAVLPLRHYPCAKGPLLVMVHGSGWHGGQFAALAEMLATGGHAQVLVPDLRGHGIAPRRRGDIDYIDQLEDDLADLVAAYDTGRKLVMLGHSSGGGLVIRALNGALKGRADHAILLAPFLKHNAPTARESSGWAITLTRRIVGLSMLNMLRFCGLNGLTTVQFRFPDAVLDGPLGHTATRSYSYRMMTGFAPRAAYLKDIAALPDFTLVAGTEDEAFRADRYHETMALASNRGHTHLIPALGHLDLVDAPETAAVIRQVLA